MSSPSQPAHLSNHQRSTLRQLFQHPAGHNIEWRAVLSLLQAVGSADEQHSGKVAVRARRLLTRLFEFGWEGDAGGAGVADQVGGGAERC
jgi:mannose/cellobiose epimerase-like protein (N-acyl-D-glucosamine 2-epimerase family)